MSSPDMWDRLEPLLDSVERPARYVDREFGARHAEDAEYRAVLMYPDTYEIGQANQAIGILYDVLNGIEGVAAERAFVPWVDLGDLLRARGMGLPTLESCRAVRDADLVGITLPYELTYTNVLEALDLAGIALRSADRAQSDPLVVGGGPCAFNPEPVAEFFDAVLIGEGESAAVDIVEAHRAAMAKGLDRAGVLAALAAIPGVYVPSLHAPGSATVVKRVQTSLSDRAPVSCPVVPFMDVVHDRFTVEVLRGCTRGCRFCQAGMIYRPVRERSADEIVSAALSGIACTGYEEVSLTSLSSADHSTLEEVLRRLSRRLEGTGVSVSLPSLRVDSFSLSMAQLISRGKKPGLTFAPEAATQRLRDVINKNVTEEDLLGVVTQAFENGWRRVKLYFMIGLPTETDDDVRAIGDLVYRVLTAAREATPAAQRGAVRVSVSVSTFVPKAHTPFQWEAQLERDEVARRQAVLRERTPRKGVELSWHDSDTSFLEGVMARGGRELSRAIEAAWRGGARFDAWTEKFSMQRWMDAFEECGIDPSSIANRERDESEPLPWEHLSSGVSRQYLLAEKGRAYAGQTTPDCTFAGCTGCDVCGDLSVDPVIAAGERR